MAKRMDNQSVVAAWVSGQVDVQSHSGNLWVSADGKRLMNYSTCLAERSQDLHCWIINRTSYSNSTSKIQGMILSQMWRRFGGEWIQENTIEVDNMYGGGNYGGGVSSLVQAAHDKIEWSKGLYDVKLINYFDVWGNKKDGWEINNLYTEDNMSFQLHEDDFYNHEKIFRKLKDVGFFKPRTRMTQVDFEDLHEFGVEITQRKDGMPICRIEFVKNGVNA